MYKMCKSEQSAARQRELEKGLLQVMSTRHYEEISVSDLCDHIGIPRKSFYRYFSGKDGALHALIDHTLLEYESRTVPTKGRQLCTNLRELEIFFSFWLEQKPLLDALQRSSLVGELITRAISQAMSEAGVSGDFFDQLDKSGRQYAAMFSTTGLMSMVAQWHKDGYAQTPRQMAVIAEAILTKPLLAKTE